MTRANLASISIAFAALLATACDTTLSKDNPYDPDLPEGQKQPATLSGQISLEVGEAPTATVEVRPAGKYATPGEDGQFLITGIAPGTYTVLVSAPGHSTWSQGGLYLAVGQDVNLGPISLLAARGALSGGVRLELDDQNAAETHGGAVVFAARELQGRLAAGDTGKSTISNPDGTWTLTDLPVGTYQINGSKDGFAPSQPVDVTVTEGETTPVPDLVLRSITGVIRIDDGAVYTNDADGSVMVTVLAFETDEMQIAEDPEFPDEEWEQYNAQRPFELSAGDGEKTVYMRFRNDSGYETPPVYDTIVLDRQPPVAASVQVAGGAAYVNDAQVALRLDALDDLSGVAAMRTALQGEDITAQPWVDFSTQLLVELPVGQSPDGVSSEVQAQFRDGAGNTTEVVSDSVIVDGVPPQDISVVIELGAARTASRDVALTLNADGAREMQVSNDSGLADADWQPYSPTLGWRLTDGDERKTVFARFRDAALNESAVAQDSIELDTRGSLSGVFLLEGAAADGNADITVALDSEPPLTVPTQTDGSFAFVDIPVGVYALEASKDGFRTASLPYLEVEPGGDLVLDPQTLTRLRGGFSGTATRQGADADGHGGIVVEVAGSGRSTVTSDAGVWTLENIPVGQYTVRATASGYLEDTITDATVVADTVTPVGALVLAPNPGSITGTVSLEGLAAPELDIAEVLVAGQTVVCETDGSFKVQGVTAGAYALTARAPGYASQQALVKVEPGENADLAPIALVRARGHLGGIARLEGEADHSGIQIAVQGTDFSTITNASGGWTIRDVLVGQYTVEASKFGFVSATATDVSVTAEAETTVPALDLLANPGGIAGSVTLEGLSAPNLAVAEILVAGQIVPCAGDGSFSVSGVPAGFHDLTARAPGYSSREFPAVEVKPGEVKTLSSPIALTIARGAISGLATLAGESDHSGITVEVDGEGYAGITGVAGSYRIEGVPIGAYTLTARKDGYATRAVGGVTVVEDQTATAANVELVRQAGDFSVVERATGDENYLNDPAVKLVFNLIPPDARDIWVAEDAGFSTGGWERFTAPEHDHDLQGADGTVNVFAKFRDSALTESPVYTASTILDRVPPAATSTVTINGGADFSTSPDGEVALDLAASDPGGSGIGWVQISVDGTVDDEPDTVYAATIQNVVVALPLVDGQKTVWVKFVDLAGNRSVLPASDAIYLDRSEPVNPMIQIDGGAAYATAAMVELSLFARDACGAGYPAGTCVGGFTDPAQMMISNDPGFQGALWEAYAADRTWFLKPGDGPKAVYVEFRDGAGNASPRISAAIELDQTPPGSPLVSVQGGEVTGSPDVMLDLSANPEPAEMIVAENGDFVSASWEIFTSTRALTLSSGDGLKTVAAKFRDAAGNETGVASDTVTLDTTAPSLFGVSVDGGAAYATDVNVTVTVQADGATELLLSEAADFAGATWEAYGPSKDFVLSAGDGIKTVYCRARDAAGNVSADVSDTITLDTTDPAGSLVIDGDAPYATDRSVTLQFSGVSGDVAEVLISEDSGFDGAAWQAYQPEVAWLLSSGDGLKTVFARFRDAAGNHGADLQDDITLDTTPPGSPLVSVQGGEMTDSRDVTLDLSATPAPAEMIVAEDGDFSGASWQAHAATLAFTLSVGDGPKTVSAKFRDAAGNESSTATDTVTLDTLAPSLFGVAVDNGAAYAADVNVTVTVQAEGADELLLSEAADFAGATWEAYGPSKAFVLSAGDGLKTVYCRARDAAGNESADASDTITLDTTDPAGSVVIDGDAPYATGRSVTLQFSGVSGDVTEVMASEDSGFADGVWLTYQSQLAWLLSTGDGLKTVYVKFRDAAENESADANDTITLDTAGPTSPTLSIDEGSYANTPDINLTLSAVNADEMQVAENPAFSGASWEPYATARAFTLSSGDGQKIVYARFRDAAGNQSDIVSDVVVLDTGEPYEPSISIDAGAQYTTGAVVTLYLSARDAAEMLVSELADLSDASWEPYAVSKTWTFAAGDGVRTVYARFRDAALNQTAIVSDDITLDTTDPVGSLAIDGGAGSTATRSVSLDFSGVSADVTDVMISEDSGFLGAIWQDYTASIPYTLSAGDATKTVYARFRDAAGNESADVNDTITLDTSAPSNPSVVIDGGALYNNSAAHELTLTLSAAGSAEMNLAEAQDFSGATGWIAVSSPYTYTLANTTDGEKTIYARFRDAAGNESATVSDGVVHDATAPTANTLRIDNGATYTTATDGKVDLYVDASDATSGVNRIRIRNSGGVFGEQSYASLISGWVLASPTNVDGATRTVEVEFVDRAGNASTPVTSDDITLDNVAPSGESLTIIDPEGNGDGYATQLSVDLTLSAGAASEMKISNGNSCGGGSWEPYATSATWTLPGDGAGRFVSVRFRDMAGNESGCTADSIDVDTKAPELPGVVIDDGALYNNDSPGHELNLTLTVVGAAEVNIGEDPSFTVGSGWIAYQASYGTTGYDYALTDASDGEKVIYVQYRDAAGNQTAVVSDSVIHDTTAPSGGFVQINNDAEYSRHTGGLVSIYSGASDALSGLDQVELSNTGAFSGEETAHDYAAVITGWALSSPTNVNGETRTVYARFVDKAGNASGVVSDGITLDNVAPAGTVTIAGGAAYANTRAVELDFTADAEVTEVAISNAAITCSSAAYDAYTTPRAWSLSAGDEPKTVSVCFRDAAGNTTPDSDGITLDTTAPTITTFTIDSGAAFTNDTSRQVDLRYFADDANGIASVEAANEGTFASPTALAWDELTDPNLHADWTLTAGDGAKAVYLRATDAAGNQATLEQTIVLDTSSPEGGAIALDPTDYVSGGSVTAHLEAVGASQVCLTGTFDDADGVVPGVDCTSASDPSWQPFKPDLTIALSSGDGTKTVTAYYRDGAGNAVGPYSDSVVRDEGHPAITAFTLTGQAATAPLATQYTRDRNVTAALTASDTGPSGLAQMRFWEDPSGMCDSPVGDWLPYAANSLQALSAGDADKIVCSQVRDAAGNASPAGDALAQVSMMLDTESPQVPLILTGTSLFGVGDPEISGTREVDLNIYADDGAGSDPYRTRISRTAEFSGGWSTYADTVSNYDLADPSTPTCRRLVMINEVSFSGDDRVELYNATGMEIDLQGWTLECYVGAAPAAPTVTWTLPHAILFPGELLALDEGAGASTWNYLYLDSACGWGDTASDPGAAILKNGLGDEVDFVRWNNNNTTSALSDGWAEPAALSCAGGCGRTSEGFDRNTSADWCEQADSIGTTNGDACGLASTDCADLSGYRSVFVQVQDAAGNGTVGVDDILLDLNPPEGWFEIDQGAEFTTDVFVDLSVQAWDDSGTVWDMGFTEDPTQPPVWLGYATSEVFELTGADGENRLWLGLRDEAGNEFPALYTSAAITLDRLAPNSPCAVAALSGNEVAGTRYVNDTRLEMTITGTDDTSGITEYQASEDSGFLTSSWLPYDGLAIATLGSGDGATTVYARLKDAAGNAQGSECGSVDVTLDTRAPALTAEAPVATKLWDEYHVGVNEIVYATTCEDDYCYQLWFEGDVVDGAGTVPTGTWVDEATWASGTVTLSAGTGNKSITILARDAALNESVPAFLDVQVDTVRPTKGTVTLYGLGAAGDSTSYTRDRTVTVDLMGFSDDTGTYQMMVSEDSGFSGADWQTYADNFNYTLSGGDAAKTLYVKVRDPAGNETADPQVSGSITLDTQPPIVNLDITGQDAEGDSSLYTHERLVDLDITANDLGGTGAYQMELSRDGSFSGTWVAFAASVSNQDLVDTAIPTCRDKGVWINEIDVGSDRAELANATGYPVDLTGWVFRCEWDGSEQLWTLPDFQLGPWEKVALYEGAGTDTDNRLYLGGDCGWSVMTTGSATLSDAEGNAVDFLRFDGSLEPPPAGVDWDDSLGILSGSTYYSRTNLEFDRDLSGDWCGQGSHTLEADNISTCGLSWADCDNISGSRPIYVQVQDHAGNLANASSSILLDVQAPAGGIVINDDEAATNDDVVNLTMTYGDDLSGTYQTELGEAADTYASWQDPVDSLTYTITQGDGTAKMYVRYQDRAGNLSPAYSDSILLDTANPSTCTVEFDDLTDPTNDPVKSLTITLGDATSTITEILLSEDSSFSGASWQPATASQNWVLSSEDGDKTVYIRCKDEAGNTVDGTSSSTITLDRTAPVASSIEINDDDEFVTQVDVSLTYDESTGDAWRAILDNNPDFSSPTVTPDLSGPLPWTLPAGNGPRQVFLKFADEAGNESAVIKDTIFLDTTVPAAPEIVALSGYASSMYVDLDDVTDAVSGIAYYEIEASRDFVGFGIERSTRSTMSEGTIHGIPPFTTWCFRARAADNAGNIGPYSDEDCSSGGLSKTVTENIGAGQGGTASAIDVNGMIFTEVGAEPTGGSLAVTLRGCDTRYGRCADNLFEDRDDAGADLTGWMGIWGLGLDTAFADYNGIWLAQIEGEDAPGTGRRLDTFHCDISQNGRCEDFTEWNRGGFVTLPDSYSAQMWGGTANGRAAYVFTKVDGSNNIDVITCDLAAGCDGGDTDWSRGTAVNEAAHLPSATQEVRAAYAGEHQVWLVQANSGNALSLATCLSREDCTDTSNWHKVEIAKAGAIQPNAVNLVEADGYLRIMVYWFIGALVDTVSLYTCPVDGNLSCTDFAADFTEAEIHTDLDLITRAGERGGIESYNGRLFLSYTAATEAYLAWCRLGATDCSAAADFTEVKIADELYMWGDISLVLPGGNPLMFAAEDDHHNAIIEPQLYAPYNSGIGPTMDKTAQARWDPRPDVGGYGIQYDVGPYAVPFDSEVKIGSPTTPKYEFDAGDTIAGGTAGWSQQGMGDVPYAMQVTPFAGRFEYPGNVASPRTSSFGDPVAIYGHNAQCRVMAWAESIVTDVQDDLMLAACPLGSTCEDWAADWNAVTVEPGNAPGNGNRHPANLALLVEDDRVWVAYRYEDSGIGNHMWVEWMPLAGDCSIGAQTRTRIADDDQKAQNVGLASDGTYVWAMFNWDPTGINPKAAIRRCLRANCDDDADWAPPSEFPVQVTQAPAGLAAGGKVFFAGPTDSAGTALFRCDVAASGNDCRDHDDWTSSLILDDAVSNTSSLVLAGGKLLYRSSGNLAWCHEGPDCGTASGAEWQHGYISPSWKNVPYWINFHAMGGMFGLSGGTFVSLETHLTDVDGDTNKTISRACEDRCWKLSSRLGTGDNPSTATRVVGRSASLSGLHGAVLPDGTIDFVLGQRDITGNRDYWILLTGAKMDLFQF